MGKENRLCLICPVWDRSVEMFVVVFLASLIFLLLGSV